MTWTLTLDPDSFAAAAGGWLRSKPVQHTTVLTVLQTVRERGLSAYGDQPPQFGWHSGPDGTADGAFLRTPPFPMLLAPLPAGAAGSLFDLLQARDIVPAGMNMVQADADAVTAAWRDAAGGSTSTVQRTRLYRLGLLLPPDPPPPGRSRLAATEDTGLLIDWHEAFADEAGTHGGQHAERQVADLLDRRAAILWEDEAVPVSMATLSRTVAGVTRVGQVYTPPLRRRSGYGAAVTTAATQAALGAGSAEVVLFTDLANPTSNAIYQRLGYEPLMDWCALDLLPAGLARSAG
jgi:GNAT superfamily N-acetyltransferase